MEIFVLSQKSAELYAQDKHKTHSAIISITSVGDDLAKIKPSKQNNIDYICRVQFDDTDRHTENAITTEQGKSISDFVKIIENSKVPRLIVHCGAGQSRSAGVAAAIMKYTYGNDLEIFSKPMYHPNMLCYRTVLNALMMDE